MPLPATRSDSRRVSSTVSESPGQPGADGTYPASRNNSTHGSHELAWSHKPCTNTTGLPVRLIFGELLPVSARPQWQAPMSKLEPFCPVCHSAELRCQVTDPRQAR